MDVWKIATIGLGTYVFGQLLLFKTSVDAMDYWDVRGYLNGLVRGSGSREVASGNLNAWRNYWLQQSGWAKPIIDSLYSYGAGRINAMY